MTRFTIGKQAEAAGIGVESIGFYERRGLINQPVPVKSSFREYPESAVSRIRVIKRAQDLGFTLSEIAEQLTLSEQTGASRKSVRDLATKKLELIREMLNGLRHMESTLSKLISECNGKGLVNGCPIIDAIAALRVESTVLAVGSVHEQFHGLLLSRLRIL